MMSGEIDPNKAIGIAGAELIRGSFESIYNGLSSNIRSIWKRLSEDFSEYSKKYYAHNRMIRIICCRDEDVDLYKVYVPAKFKNTKAKISDQELIQRVRDGKNTILVGSGGSGKTLFIRHLWLTIFENPSGKVPIFIELRSINDLTEQNLISFMRLTISPSGELSEKDFIYFCESGAFCFLLDGLDELSHELRKKISKNIHDLSRQYKECSFFITSRPDNIFSGWSGFDVFQCCRFEYEQSIELVRKLPFDDKRRELLIRKFDKEFFDEYNAFLSNPLLTIIFLMTFRDQLHIPEKLTSFYNNSFNALYTYHDSTKIYVREKYLDISEFKLIFSIFSLLTYYDEAYEFTQDSINKYIDKTKSVLQVEYDNDKIIEDFTKNVCLLIQDGLNYVYVHRSFQEYFAASALVGPMKSRFSKWIEKFVGRKTEMIIPMSFELDEELVINSFIEPFYREHLEPIKARVGSDKKFYTLKSMNVQFPVFFATHASNCTSVIAIVPNIVDIAYCIEKSLSPQKHLGEYELMTIYDNRLIDVSKEIESWFRMQKDLIQEKLVFFVHLNLEENSYSTEFSIVEDAGLDEKVLNDIELRVLSCVGKKENKISDILEEMNRKTHQKLVRLKKKCEERLEKSRRKMQSLDELLAD